MGAAFRDPPLLQHIDPVRILHRGQSVGNGDAGSACHHRANRLLDPALRLHIQCGCRLIQQKYRRILQDRSGNGKALFLSTGENGTPFSHHRLITFGQCLYEIMNLRLFAGFHDLFFRRSRLAVGDVLRDGRGEQEYILGNQRDLLPQGFPVPFLDWSAKDPVFSARFS